ncbi:MAG: single-stranded DNA-binding protein [Chloroflexi bacterium RBG_16_57_8]|nr:MAG: single-stranded DNA-binding protein [Chloroflexi bacterium RBG_16_57_8]
MQRVITDDLNALLDVLPPHVREALNQQGDVRDLTEVVLDLGRQPEARFPQREMVLSPREVNEEDIEYITSRISQFGEDNRAGIERTLHRISAIRNRRGRVVGLTCRVGRAVFGTIKVIQDLIESGESVLLLGRPGIGKTTMLREVARVLADDLHKRVIVVDTSNEIAGDGDIPHPGIGHSRRMQVTTPAKQHAVMIEAVENHMPEVIVIDEIGTELEAQAARTIAERGVQLVGTAHGNTLENLLLNPTLSDLVGGIQSVTLGDEEARRRGTQKTVLERRAPPTFDIVVEIQERDKVAVHPDVAQSVDALLRDQLSATEQRWLDEDGEVHREKAEVSRLVGETGGRMISATRQGKGHRVYLFGVNRGRLEQMVRETGLDVEVVERLSDADIFVTSKQYYRRKPQKVREAEGTNIPIFVLRSNTPAQFKQFLNTIHHVAEGETEVDNGLTRALSEAQAAAEQVKTGGEAIDLSPQTAYIRRLQHLIAQRTGVSSRSSGDEPKRRVRIYRG